MDVAKYLYAVGQYNALAFSVFGLEDAFDPLREKTDELTLALLHMDQETFDIIQDLGQQLGQAYSYTESMDSLIRNSFKKGKMHGFIQTNDNQEIVSLSKTNLSVNYNPNNKVAGGGFIIELDDYEFIVCGIQCEINFISKDESSLVTLVKEEGNFVNGIWNRKRILNGDERYHNIFTDQVNLLRFKYVPYKK